MEIPARKSAGRRSLVTLSLVLGVLVLSLWVMRPALAGG